MFSTIKHRRIVETANPFINSTTPRTPSPNDRRTARNRGIYSSGGNMIINPVIRLIESMPPALFSAVALPVKPGATHDFSRDVLHCARPVSKGSFHPNKREYPGAGNSLARR